MSEKKIDPVVSGPDGIFVGEEPNNEITPEERAAYGVYLESQKTAGDGSQTGGTGRVGWLTNTRGDAITQYQDVQWAKNYMNPTVAEYPWLVDTYNKVKSAGLTSARTPLTWWAKVVDQAATSGFTPFQIAKSYSGDAPTEGGTPGGISAAEQQRRLELTKLNRALSQDPESDLTGDAGEIQNALTKYSDYMGLMKSRKEINSLVKGILEQKTDTDTVTNELRKQAIVLYPNFADRLKADSELTVRDLVNPYIEVMADTLEVDPNSIKLTDPTIMNAVSGTNLRSLNDFRMDMRNDNRFATTRTAKREAVDFAQSLLKGFGFSV